MYIYKKLLTLWLKPEQLKNSTIHLIYLEDALN